ncbi:adult-specific rigid cuticular protein 15.5 [Ixodes scapularis]|uniref:adult-specific rigid cuticular protein 15.5 n=1 Tax=Ixodes scapularis TaxID=6945 RepID=UPI001A9D7FBE|nr:adult-specific rigid cuticular protein 15.5 [Ixodes scapularis]
MKCLIIVCCLLAYVNAGLLHAAPAAVAVAAPAVLEAGTSSQYRNEDHVGNYNFGYDESHTSGGSFRRETGNALGVKTGSYGLTDADGRVRVVHYVADEHGFRVSVATNEPGTQVSSPAAASITRPATPVVVKGPVAAVAAPLAAPVATAVVAPVAGPPPKPVATTVKVSTPVAVATPVALKEPSHATRVVVSAVPVQYATAYHSHVYKSPVAYSLPVFAYSAAQVPVAHSFVYGHKVTHAQGSPFHGYAYL